MGWVGDLCRRFSITCLHWWMMLTHEMVCKDEASFGVTAETVEKRQHVQFPPWIPTLFSPALLPLGLENNSLHPRQKYRGRKEISRHKSSLCNAVKLHWFFFVFFVYLTDNIKLLLHVMSRWALEITSALPVLLNSLVKMFLGRGIVERPWLLVFICVKSLPLHSDTSSDYRKSTSNLS